MSAHHDRPTQVPNVATDAIVVKPSKGDPEKHEILLITRLREPFQGSLAFPGGFVDYNEDPERACLRELEEECHIKGKKPVLVTVAGDPKRDPRKHVISIVYNVEMEDPTAEAEAGDDAASAKWYDLDEVLASKDMAFDHKEILKAFLQKSLPQYLK
jgi:8-oxo-dGTP diphosphatase